MSELHEILVAPHITEETMKNMVNKRNDVHKYVFKVAKTATKTEIKDAIEKRFNVKVDSVNTLINRGRIDVMLTNATLDLRHVMGGKTDVGAYAHSTVTKGDIRGEYKQSDYDRAPKMLGIHIGLGLNIALPMAFSSNQQGSPYNTNHAFEFHILGQISDFPISKHWSWNINIDASATWMQLDNVVAAQDDQLVLDPSYGATPPRQSLYYCPSACPLD